MASVQRLCAAAVAVSGEAARRPELRAKIEAISEAMAANIETLREIGGRGESLPTAIHPVESNVLDLASRPRSPIIENDLVLPHQGAAHG